MLKKSLLLFVMLLTITVSIFAANDIENLFLRKAVKEYVAKDYSAAIKDLKQVLIANSANVKAQRLIVKSYLNLGADALEKNNGKLAKSSFASVLKYDAGNGEATNGLAQANSLISSQRVAVASQNSTTSQQPVPVQQVQPQVIYNQPATSSKTDSVQAKVIAGLFNNFSTQQKLFEKQIDASSKALANTEDTKEKYLNALMDESKKNSNMMKTYMVIGAGVALGIILLILLFFGIIFRSVAKASDLRTVQANETLQLLLATSAGGNGASPLLLSGPNAKAGNATDNIVTIDSLENEDPAERANAVEAIAADIVDEKEDSRIAKINKLEELLNDDNNRVRANAAKALYEIDKEKSLFTLKGMIENDSKRMRASAIWALGEIATEEAMELVLTLSSEEDEIVRFNVKSALNKIVTLKKFPISAEMKLKLDEVIEKSEDLV